MKKLFAIVMVLAMALAIAAPALASGWDEIEPEVVDTGDIEVEVIPLATTASTGFGGSYYPTLAAADLGPVVAGTKVHFLVVITIPDDISAGDKTLLKEKGLDYELTLTNLSLVTADCDATAKAYNAKVAWSDYAALAKSALSGKKSFYLLEDWTNAVITLEYWATATKAGEAKAVADIGFSNKWNGDTFVRHNAKGELVFTVKATSTLFTITDPKGNYITFPVDDGKIDDSKRVQLYVAATTTSPAALYSVSRGTAIDLTFAISATENATGTEYAAAKKVFDAFFTALGFGYPDAKYMQTEHFTKYFGPIAAGTDKVVYFAGAIVVAPPAVEPPQTGDATTVVGFVMIALALVAAAAVTVKKVRA